MSVTPKDIIQDLLYIAASSNPYDAIRALADCIEREGIAPPDGYAIVPIEPTAEMVQSYCDAVANHLGNMTDSDWERERLDPVGNIKKVAKVGLSAMLTAAKESL